MRSITSLIVIIFITISCGKKINKSTQSKSEYEINNQQHYAEFVLNSTLSSNVPEGLGQMLIRVEKAQQQAITSCTWTLVDDDLAITNSHCVPANILDKDCSKFIGGTFMTSDGVVHRQCRRIIYASSLSKRNLDSSDIALIQLDLNVNAKRFSLDRSGISRNEILEVHSVQMKKDNANKLVGHYRKSTCIAKNSHFYGRFETPMSKTIAVFDSLKDSCDVGESDLGAAVTGFRNSLKAVLFSKKQKPLDLDSSIYSVSEIQNVALVTNLSCESLHDTKLDSGRFDACDDINNEDKKVLKQKLEVIKDQARKLIYYKIKTLRSSFPSSFDYSINVDEIGESKDVGVQIIPKCINAKDSWTANELSKTETHGIIGWRKTKYTTELPIYRAQIEVYVNEYAQYDLKASVEKVGKNILKIEDISTISEAVAGNVEITQDIFKFKSKPKSKPKSKSNIKIKVCK